MTRTMLPSPPSEMSHSPTYPRKRTAAEADDQNDQTFALTDLTSTGSWAFEPVSRLLRAHLPLSWLAPVSSNPLNDIIPGTAAQGCVKSVPTWDYAILVARRVPNGGLVALEKVQDDYFVLYPLQPFVTEKWVQDASIGASPSASLQTILHYLPVHDAEPRIHAKRLATPTNDAGLTIPKVRPGAAARLSILNLPCKTETPPDSPPMEELAVSVPQAEPVAVPEKTDTLVQASVTTPIVNTASGPQTDMLSIAYLRQRYQDHLYMTKTSLAYYTKGPLSRARARSRAQDSSMTLADLATFYRDSLLPIKRMDVKYKETLPHLISSIDPNDVDPSTRISRKTKLGKDGLWPMEQDLVLRWWRSRDSKRPAALESHSSQSRDAQDAIASLRMREAQMQMILMLESLSIEIKQRDATLPPKSIPDNSDMKVESVEQDQPTDIKKTPAKKSRDLEADLELLADRLCIWHSVGLEGSILSSQEPTKEDEEDLLQSKDRLRNFCVDVLIPFYSARLPTLCKNLCKTLAGPDLFEQTQKSSRRKDVARSVMPGTVVRRRVSSATSRDMERVTMEKGLRQSSPSVLSRSSTLPPLPKFQREASELSQRPPAPHSRQPSLSFTNREIDLVADAEATASKKRKLGRVASHKQDLAAAIQALKKPDRHNVSSAYMDEVEKRKSELKLNSVQITATPQANRKVSLKNSNFEPLLPPNFELEHAVLASSTKRGSLGIMDITSRSSSKKKAVLAAIQNTPSKRACWPVEPLQNDVKVTSGAILYNSTAENESCITATPSKPRATRINMPTIRGKQGQAAKSLIEQGDDFRLPDVALKAMDRAMTMPIASTIYETLGWDDDDV